MEVLQRAEQPRPSVTKRRHERRPHRLAFLRVLEAVLLHAQVGEGALGVGHPSRRFDRVGEEKGAGNCHEGGSYAFDDELPKYCYSVQRLLIRYCRGHARGCGLGTRKLPSPSCEASRTIETRKDAGSNQIRER